MGSTKWVVAVVVAVLIVAGVVLLLPREAADPNVPPVLEPIPEDIPPPVDRPAFVEFDLVAFENESRPSILAMYAGQRGEIRLNALDLGAGDGYRMVLPSFDISVEARPGAQGVQSFEPSYYGTFRYDIISGGEVVDSGSLVVRAE